jgi:hypothetical protein
MSMTNGTVMTTFPSTQDERLDDLERRVKALEERMVETPAPPAPTPGVPGPPPQPMPAPPPPTQPA